MPLPLNDGFQVSSMDPIDTRIILTKEQMLNAVLDDYPDVYFAFCVDDGQWYRFDYEVDSPDPETGNFKKLELGGSTPASSSGSTSEMQDALANASAGDLWYNTDDGKVYYCAVDSEGNKSWQEKQPSPGEMMFNEDTGKIMYYDGTEWKEVGSLDGVPSGSVEPANPQPGDQWLDTSTTPPTLVYYGEDGQWHPVDPKAGEMMYDETSGKILYYDGLSWKELGGTETATVGTSAPSPAHVGDQWLDTNQNPPVLKEWDGTQWNAVGAKEGDMMYDATNDVVMYYDGTQWKPIGGGVEHVPSVDPTQPGEEGKIVYDETSGQYKIYEDGVWLTLAKTWEGTTAEYTALGSNYSTNHPDVIMFITD